MSMCTNRSAHCTPANSNNLDEEEEIIRQEVVPHEFRTALQKVIVAEEMIQAQLATANSEKRAVITAYESGKAILDGVTMSKTQKKTLRVKLFGAK